MECARACINQRSPSPRIGYAKTVVLLHGSAGTGALWRDLRDKLDWAYQIVAPDLIGYGSASAWSATTPLRLEDEVARLEAELPCCDGQLHLVGYSYGGAVALCMAAAALPRIASLTLIEPVLFGSLRQAGESGALAELFAVRDRYAASLDAGRAADGLQEFIDFWAGQGAWQRMPARVRAATVEMAAKIRLDWEASFAYDAPAASLATLGPRTLLLRGERSPSPMLKLVECLHAQMPGSRRVVIAGSGHLLPITHASELAAAVIAHLHEAAERSQS